MLLFNRIDEKTWLELDSKLIEIENEWKKEQNKINFIWEFSPNSFRILDDIEDLTVLEHKYWKRLLASELGNNFKKGKVFTIRDDGYYYSSISMTEWIWTCKNEQYYLFDMSFEICNDKLKICEEYGGIFLDEKIVLVNSLSKLQLTKYTPDILVDRIPSLEYVRGK